MAEPISELDIFVRVVDTGSFTRAAAALGISTSYVSRRIRSLEDRLGVRLLERTTRRVRPTEVGRRYRDRVAPLLDGLNEAAREACSLETVPRGVLRVAAPLAFGMRYLTAPVARFLERWPELEVVVDYSDRRVDLVADGYDLAIRGGRLSSENLIARRLLDFRGVVAASPAYLAQHGRPRTPDDLLHHACLVNTALRSMPGWAFETDSGPHTVSVQGRFRSDSGDAIVQAAIAGLGIAYEPTFLAHDAIEDGRLVTMLEEYPTYEGAFFALYPDRRHLSAKVRAFIDHLVETWSDPPWSGACASESGG